MEGGATFAALNTYPAIPLDGIGVSGRESCTPLPCLIEVLSSISLVTLWYAPDTANYFDESKSSLGVWQPLQ